MKKSLDMFLSIRLTELIRGGVTNILLDLNDRVRFSNIIGKVDPFIKDIVNKIEPEVKKDIIKIISMIDNTAVNDAMQNNIEEIKDNGTEN